MMIIAMWSRHYFKSFSSSDIRVDLKILLKKAGLNPSDYQSITHLVRHTSAQMVYNLTGDLNATQAHTGHRNRGMVENLYAAEHPKKLASRAMSKLSESFLEN